jgi:hypothetical protein
MKASDERRVILQILKDTSPQALPENSLWCALDSRVRPAVSAATFDEHIAYLSGHKLIAIMEGEFGDDEPRWLITEAGEVQLLKR